MADPRYVMIRHKDGREYSVLPRDFTNPRVSADGQSYADQGFRITGYSDGTPYDGPTTLREIEKAQAERQAVREQRATARTADKPADMTPFAAPSSAPVVGPTKDV